MDSDSLFYPYLFVSLLKWDENFRFGKIKERNQVGKENWIVYRSEFFFFLNNFGGELGGVMIHVSPDKLSGSFISGIAFN